MADDTNDQTSTSGSKKGEEEDGFELIRYGPVESAAEVKKSRKEPAWLDGEPPKLLESALKTPKEERNSVIQDDLFYRPLKKEVAPKPSPEDFSAAFHDQELAAADIVVVEKVAVDKKK